MSHEKNILFFVQFLVFAGIASISTNSPEIDSFFTFELGDSDFGKPIVESSTAKKIAPDAIKTHMTIPSLEHFESKKTATHITQIIKSSAQSSSKAKTIITKKEETENITSLVTFETKSNSSLPDANGSPPPPTLEQAPAAPQPPQAPRLQ